jgi:hypothetical protein
LESLLCWQPSCSVILNDGGQRLTELGSRANPFGANTTAVAAKRSAKLPMLVRKGQTRHLMAKLLFIFNRPRRLMVGRLCCVSTINKLFSAARRSRPYLNRGSHNESRRAAYANREWQSRGRIGISTCPEPASHRSRFTNTPANCARTPLPHTARSR